MKVEPVATGRPSSGPEIHIRTESTAVDLHNFAEFRGLHYTPRTLTLEWMAAEGPLEVSGEAVSIARLHFLDVREIRVNPFDSAVPLSEGQTLEFFLVIQTDPLQVRFTFQDGLEIEVEARAWELETSPHTPQSL